MCSFLILVVIGVTAMYAGYMAEGFVMRKTGRDNYTGVITMLVTAAALFGCAYLMYPEIYLF